MADRDEEPQIARGYFVVTDGTKFSEGEPVQSGCGDRLIERGMEVKAHTWSGQFKELLTRMFAGIPAKQLPAGTSNYLETTGLAVKSVSEKGGQFTVNLSGKLKLGGTCSVPRFKDILRLTAKPYGKVTFELNGSEQTFRCLGDESGTCK